MLKTLLIGLISIFIISCNQNSTNKGYYPDKLDITPLHIISDNERNGEGGFILLENNVLAYVYTCFIGGSQDSSYSDICVIKSSDKDREIWTNPEILIINHGAQNIMSVSLLRYDDKKILIQYLEKNSLSDLKIVRRFSDNNLNNISKIDYVNVNNGYNVVNNDRVINYKDNIYTPISRHCCDKGVSFVYPGVMELAITDKNNNTKLITIPTDDNITFQEPGVVKLDENGHLLFWFRNNTNKMLISHSLDYGKTFTSIEKSIINTVPFSPSSIKNINNDLFVVYNEWTKETKKQERTPLVLVISRDGLNTIDKKYVLENDKSKGYMYTSIYKDNDSLILAYMFTTYGEIGLKVKIIKLNNIFLN